MFMAKGNRTSKAPTRRKRVANNPRRNKMEAVRQALDHLGNEAKPEAILKFVKESFNVVMSRAMASNYKSSVLRKAAIPSTLGGRAEPRAGAAHDRYSFEDIATVKNLANRIGVENLRRLAEVLGK
jgi:hypothetical protein